ncbi:MAG TPA: phosphocholine cytidylyltransferase family protein [Kofleriaceae bacterium]|nr:phosphocholine cytidylyltransferase family protein [Kofleriaceae bacterium]
MKAVLLVAGMSSRLRPLTDDRPKCLLEVAGTPILKRCVDALRGAGITELVVVTGYLEDKIKAALEAWFPGPITYRRNAEFSATQNGASLLCARAVVEGEPFVMLDGDIVFDPEVLAAVVRSPHADCLALRPATDLGEEEVKVYLDGDRVRRIHVSIPPAEAAGESIGIEKFSAQTSRVLFATIEQRIAQHGPKTEYYEKAFDQLCQDGVLDLRAIDVGAYYCAEIDTPADLAEVDQALRARMRVEASA